LIRIDVGIFCLVLWIGLLAARLFDRSVTLGARAAATAAGLAIIFGTTLLLHGPVYLDAKRRGFDAEFLGQYSSWVTSLAGALHFRIAEKPPRPSPAHHKAPRAAASDGGRRPAHSWNREILRRGAWHDFVHAADAEKRLLIVLTYAPIVALLPLVLGGAIQFTRAAIHADSGCMRRALAALVLLGGALTTFPQFFFFRPDSPHLSEFSPGFWVAIAGSALLLRPGGTNHTRWVRVAMRAFVLFLCLHASLYLWRTLPDRWTGTIAARKGRSVLFSAENGVNVYLGKRELRGLKPMLELIRRHSQPGEYLVAYPYHPAINLLADRPTYEKNVYVDNATRTRNWDAEAIERFQRHRPAVIVLSDWDINGTEASRFSVWATDTKTWVQENYLTRAPTSISRSTPALPRNRATCKAGSLRHLFRARSIGSSLGCRSARP
jgi:hypothetical protein